MTADLTVDMRNIVRELQMVDKKFAASVRREIRAACLELGEDVLWKIRRAASWSTGHSSTEKRPRTSIPDATTLRPNFTLRSAGVRIVTSRAKAPEAALFELGNKGGNVGPGTFTNGSGGTIGKRPFFYAAAREIDGEAEARIRRAIDIVCREAGFR